MEKIIWNYPDHIVRQQLRLTRHWTNEVIDYFLTPDLVVPNPHNPSQNMRLYLLKKVYATEELPAFHHKLLETSDIKPSVYYKCKKELKKRRRNFNNARRRLNSIDPEAITKILCKP